MQLRVRGESEELAAKIKEMKGVQDVQAKGEGLIEFQFSPGQDLRPQVARLVVESKYDLLEMRSVNLSLEEIFLQLTRDDVPSPAEVQAVNEE